MLDITTVQTFKIPPSIKVLQESNDALKLVNDSLTDKNDNLKKILIVTFIGVGLLVVVRLLKNRKTNKEQKR
jgi:hypothetical protein